MADVIHLHSFILNIFVLGCKVSIETNVVPTIQYAILDASNVFIISQLS